MRLVLILLASMFATACASNAATPESRPAPRVSSELVPGSLLGGSLSVSMYEGKEAKAAFAAAGDKALVADGKLWEIRSGATLVGVLQISTTKPRVDLSRSEDREAITSILSGGLKRIEVQGVPVTFTQTPDQVRYLWFGADLFEVLTLKASKVDPEAALTDLIRYQARRPEWRPLAEDENR